MVEADSAWGLSDQIWMGRSMSELFHLMPDNDGSFPLLTALAEQADFIGQRARVALGLADGTVAMLKAHAMHDDGEVFTGFYGSAAPVGFGQLPIDVAVPQIADPSEPSNLLGNIDVRSFALRIDGAMRRPLGRIIANAETIAGQLQGPIRADYARYASDIALAGRHLLDLVDDLADLPETKPFPNGAHVAKMFISKVVKPGKHPSYVAKFVYQSSLELSNPTDVPPNPGDEATVFLHTKKKDGTPNEIGQGQLKMLLNPIAEKLNTRSVNEIILATKDGIDVAIVTSVRKQEGYSDSMNVSQCTVV
jgi:hypothetical protein